MRLDIFDLAGLLISRPCKVITRQAADRLHLTGLLIKGLLHAQRREVRAVHLRLQCAGLFVIIHRPLKLHALGQLYLGKFEGLAALAVIYGFEAHERDRYLGGIAVLIHFPACGAKQTSGLCAVRILAPLRSSAQQASALVAFRILSPLCSATQDTSGLVAFRIRLPACDTKYIAAHGTVLLQTKVELAAQVQTPAGFTVFIHALNKHTAQETAGNTYACLVKLLLLILLAVFLSCIGRCRSAALLGSGGSTLLAAGYCCLLVFLLFLFLFFLFRICFSCGVRFGGHTRLACAALLGRSCAVLSSRCVLVSCLAGIGLCPRLARTGLHCCSSFHTLISCRCLAACLTLIACGVLAGFVFLIRLLRSSTALAQAALFRKALCTLRLGVAAGAALLLSFKLRSRALFSRALGAVKLIAAAGGAFLASVAFSAILALFRQFRHAGAATFLSIFLSAAPLREQGTFSRTCHVFRQGITGGHQPLALLRLGTLHGRCR